MEGDRKRIEDEVRRELPKEVDAAAVPVEVWEQAPRQSDFPDKAVTLQLFKRTKDYAIWLVKKGWKVVKVVALVVSLYNLMYLGSEFLFPGTLPSAQEVARMAGESTRDFISEVSEDKNERFVVYSEQWLQVPTERYEQTMRDATGEAGRLLQEQNIYMIPASGVVDASGFITSGGPTSAA